MSEPKLKWRNEGTIKTPEEILEKYDLNAGLLEAQTYTDNNIAEAILSIDSLDIDD